MKVGDIIEYEGVKLLVCEENKFDHCCIGCYFDEDVECRYSGDCSHFNFKVINKQNEWISIKDRQPEYYEDIWVSDGVSVHRSRMVGRSYTPQKYIFKNFGNGCYELSGVKYWMPCIVPKPPKFSKETEKVF